MRCEHADKIDGISANQQSEDDPCVENTAREIFFNNQPVKKYIEIIICADYCKRRQNRQNNGYIDQISFLRHIGKQLSVNLKHIFPPFPVKQIL